MRKINNDDILIRGLKNPELQLEYVNWGKVNQSLVEFQRKATLSTFKRLYGDEAERLFAHFYSDCNCKWERFMTYLTRQQKSELLINVHENKIFLYN